MSNERTLVVQSMSNQHLAIVWKLIATQKNLFPESVFFRAKDETEDLRKYFTGVISWLNE